MIETLSGTGLGPDMFKADWGMFACNQATRFAFHSDTQQTALPNRLRPLLQTNWHILEDVNEAIRKQTQ